VTEDRGGFGLLEVILSMLIITVGILAMGISTVHVLGLVNTSRLTTERGVAVREATELLRATDWDDLEAACDTATFSAGHFSVTCTTSQPETLLKKVQLISIGPGYGSAERLEEIAETTAILLAEPVD
jgi:Tfp pilus assembly protein PilV